VTPLALQITAQFRKGYKRVRKRGKNTALLWDVVGQPQERRTLAARHRDHALTGSYQGFRECHIEPDWLLVYTVDEGRLILTAVATGTHSDLF
jgi:mRNA interferase YafQ